MLDISMRRYWKGTHVSVDWAVNACLLLAGVPEGSRVATEEGWGDNADVARG